MSSCKICWGKIVVEVVGSSRLIVSLQNNRWALLAKMTVSPQRMCKQGWLCGSLIQCTHASQFSTRGCRICTSYFHSLSISLVLIGPFKTKSSPIIPLSLYMIEDGPLTNQTRTAIRCNGTLTCCNCIPLGGKKMAPATKTNHLELPAREVFPLPISQTMWET